MVGPAGTAEPEAMEAMALAVAMVAARTTSTPGSITTKETVATDQNGGDAGYGAPGGSGGGAGSGSGGGVYSSQGTLYIQNTTISGNTGAPGVPGKAGLGGAAGIPGKAGAAGIGLHPGKKGMAGAPGTRGSDGNEGFTGESYGGGIASIHDAGSSIRNCTIAGNKAGDAGGGLWATPATLSDTLSVISTIIAQNKASRDVDVGGTMLIDHGLIESVGNAELGGDQDTFIIADPKLGALAKNGGPTKTMLLLAGSLAIDAGSNPDDLDTDQPPGIPASSARGSILERWRWRSLKAHRRRASRSDALNTWVSTQGFRSSAQPSRSSRSIGLHTP